MISFQLIFIYEDQGSFFLPCEYPIVVAPVFIYYYFGRLAYQLWIAFSPVRFFPHAFWCYLKMCVLVTLYLSDELIVITISAHTPSLECVLSDIN